MLKVQIKMYRVKKGVSSLILVHLKINRLNLRKNLVGLRIGGLMKLYNWSYLTILVGFGLVFMVISSLGCNGVRYVQGGQGPAVSVTTATATSLQCPTGGTQVYVGTTVTVVCNGAQGATGAAGSNGANGTNGTNGTNATPVSLIKLCPGTPSHTVFVEYAICVQNQLYAVYSANGGFLTLLSPGGYTSDGIGSACNLTVAANCVVSH